MRIYLRLIRQRKDKNCHARTPNSLQILLSTKNQDLSDYASNWHIISTTLGLNSKEIDLQEIILKIMLLYIIIICKVFGGSRS